MENGNGSSPASPVPGPSPRASDIWQGLVDRGQWNGGRGQRILNIYTPHPDRGPLPR